MPAHRQSALLLHGLAPVDRRWVLARVDPADAAVLRAHLRELRELGIPADPALAPSAAPGADGHAAVVARASKAALQLALGEEPAWLVAQVLAVRDWPWHAAFLDGLGEERRAAVAQAATATPAALAPRAAAALLAALAARLADDGAAAPPSVWDRLRRPA